MVSLGDAIAGLLVTRQALPAAMRVELPVVHLDRFVVKAAGPAANLKRMRAIAATLGIPAAGHLRKFQADLLDRKSVPPLQSAVPGISAADMATVLGCVRQP